MWSFRTIDPLPLFDGIKYVSLVGAGGKTTISEHLAALALQRKRRVAITTTTKIWAREPYVLVGQGDMDGPFARVGRALEEGKLTGLSDDQIEDLGKGFDLVLIEADGSKGLPIKYPSSYEPVIPVFTELTVVVAGLDALSGSVKEKVFRWELLSEKAGVEGADRVTPALFLRLFEADGLLKGVDPRKALIILNKYDACKEREKVPLLARELAEHTGIGRVVVASTRHAIFYECRRTGALP